MSFNPNDNEPLIITRANYEEYFLLYIDNELAAEECKAVEVFAQAHPDLQTELELLKTTKLPVEDKLLSDKQTLFADSMKLNTIDESILLYIDDELNGTKKEIIEQKLQSDKDFQLQHQLLLKTKLDKSEQIIYPYKDELYRKEKRRAPIYWMRAAAAIVVVLGIGALVWTLNRESSSYMDIAKGAGTIQPKNSIPGRQMETPEQLVNEDASTNKESKVAKNEDEQHPVQQDQLVSRSIRIGKQIEINSDNESKKETIEMPQVANNNVAAKDPVQENEDQVATVNPSENVRKQTINDNPVTSSSDDSNNNSTVTTAAFTDVAIGNEKKASLKGLLRKATRFIERRANIKATNENDELLIGAVAIQL